MVGDGGGGFVNGGSSPAVYDGSAFARQGVVFVSFNYRLGRFGFFAHPALTAERSAGPHGNYAIMDQIAALKWVQHSADRARTVYQVHDSDDVKFVALRMGEDQMMVEPARHVARELAGRGQPVYEFRFSYVAESIRGQFGGVMGAMHASDIPFAFDTVAAKYGKDLTASDAVAGRAMIAYWVAFTKTGKPEAPGQPGWPAYDPKNDGIMNFINSGPVAGPDPWKARLDLAQAVSESKQDGAAGGR